MSDSHSVSNPYRSSPSISAVYPSPSKVIAPGATAIRIFIAWLSSVPLARTAVDEEPLVGHEAVDHAEQRQRVDLEGAVRRLHRAVVGHRMARDVQAGGHPVAPGPLGGDPGG